MIKSNSILLEGLNKEELAQLIKTELKLFLAKTSTEPEGETLLTRSEACKFLSIDSSTLWSYSRSGKLKSYGIGSSRYYKRTELIAALTLVEVNPKKK